MAHITLAGTLLDPNSALAVGDKIRFTHKSTTGNTVGGAVSVLTIDPSGTYSIDLQYGLILVEYKDIRKQQFENKGVVTVNGTNPATSIPELLNATVPVSSAELIEFQTILADATTQADNSAASAVISTTQADNAAISAALSASVSNYSSKTVTVDTVLLSNTEYQTGKDLVINFDATLTIPVTSTVNVQNYSAQQQL